MQQLIELNTKLANDGLAALKQLAELNTKTTETLAAQNKELVEGYTSTTEANIEKLTAVKEPKQFLDLQNEMFQSSITFALGNWKKALATANTSRDAYRDLAESSMKTAKSNMELATESVKKTTEAATETATKAVKTAAKKAK